MADRAIRTVLDGMSYLEGPRWHAGRLYVSDFYTGDVVAVDLDGGADPETVANVPAQPSGIQPSPDGWAGTLATVSGSAPPSRSTATTSPV